MAYPNLHGGEHLHPRPCQQRMYNFVSKRIDFSLAAVDAMRCDPGFAYAQFECSTGTLFATMPHAAKDVPMHFKECPERARRTSRRLRYLVRNPVFRAARDRSIHASEHGCIVLWKAEADISSVRSEIDSLRCRIGLPTTSEICAATSS